MLDKKIVAVLDQNLSVGLAFNTLAHLAVSLGKHGKKHMGKGSVLDASGISHIGFSKYPFIILKADAIKIKEIVDSAKNDRHLFLIDFPEQAYLEYTDEEFVKAISEVQDKDIKYYGVLLFGLNNDIDKYTAKLPLWK